MGDPAGETLPHLPRLWARPATEALVPHEDDIEDEADDVELADALDALADAWLADTPTPRQRMQTPTPAPGRVAHSRPMPAAVLVAALVVAMALATGVWTWLR